MITESNLIISLQYETVNVTFVIQIDAMIIESN